MSNLQLLNLFGVLFLVFLFAVVRADDLDLEAELKEPEPLDEEAFESGTII